MDSWPRSSSTHETGTSGTQIQNQRKRHYLVMCGSDLAYIVFFDIIGLHLYFNCVSIFLLSYNGNVIFYHLALL